MLGSVILLAGEMTPLLQQCRVGAIAKLLAPRESVAHPLFDRRARTRPCCSGPLDPVDKRGRLAVSGTNAACVERDEGIAHEQTLTRARCRALRRMNEVRQVAEGCCHSIRIGYSADEKDGADWRHANARAKKP